MKPTTIKMLVDKSPGFFQINAGQKIYLVQIPRIADLKDLLDWLDRPITGLWISGLHAPEKEVFAPESIIDIFPLESLIDTDKVTHDAATTAGSNTQTPGTTPAAAVRRRAPNAPGTVGAVGIAQTNGDQGQART